MEGALNGPIELLLAKASFAETVIRADLNIRTQGFADSLRGEPGSTYRGYRVEGRAALIPIRGSLIPSGPVGLAAYGLTSYEGLRSELRRASNDPDIDTIIAMIDSPGGRVTDIDSTGDAILAARTRKPVIAVVEGMCCSAAYWLAAQCSTIIVSAFSDVGSIGVIQMHVDLSGALGQNGIKVTLIHAGSHKADGHPYAALPDDVRAEMQADANRIRDAFADAVVSGRRNVLLDHAAVLATEARSYHGAEAVGMGLADRIGTLDQVIERLPQIAAGIAPYVKSPFSRGSMMSELPAGAMLAALPVEAPIVAPPSRTPAPAAEAIRQTLAPVTVAAPAVDGGSSSPANERERIGRIMTHPFASHEAGKSTAEHYAYETDKPADEVRATLDVLASIAGNAARIAAPGLDEEMAADPQPILGSDFGRHEITDMQRGAVTAARLLGKDENEAMCKASGLTDPSPRIGPDQNAALPRHIGRESAEMLRKLGMV